MFNLQNYEMQKPRDVQLLEKFNKEIIEIISTSRETDFQPDYEVCNFMHSDSKPQKIRE